MSASILLITGGVDRARHVYEHERRADWAQALPLVLEKLGYLGVATAGPAALSDPRTWESHAAVLVTRLPEDAWTPRALELAVSGSAEVFAEMPPPALHAEFGVLAAEPAERNGVVTVSDPELLAAVAESSSRTSASLEPPQSRPVQREEGLDWNQLGVPIDADRAKRWRALGWDAERWQVGETAEVLAEWLADGGERRWPAIVRRGRLIGSSFSIFAYLGQQTTIQPFNGAEHLSWQRPAALEAMLVALLDDMHRRAGVPRPRILPWPEGADWVLNVRHDFDRAQSRKQVNRVLEVHAEAGTAATWYWRSRHVVNQRSPVGRVQSQGSNGAAVARRVAGTPGHEVALHTEGLWVSTEDERRTLESAIGRQVKGTSAHGDPTCFRWQGAPNVLWADGQGLDYTEFISHAHLHPHRFAGLGPDGLIEESRVVCLPHHESFERSTAPGDVAADSVLAAAESYVKAGGMMQILNHPDINIDELSATLRELPVEGRLDWTAAEAADWWRRTHVASELQLHQDRNGSVTVTSRRGVRGAVLEIQDPSGERRRFSLHIEAGGSVEVGGTSAVSVARPRDPEQRWLQEVGPAFADAAGTYYERKGIDPASQEALSTVATNSELVPERVRAVQRYLAELGGVDSMAGMRVLDCGAGFGAFAAYLSLQAGASRVSAVDLRGDFAEIATEVAERVGLPGFAYEVADMRTLDAFEDSSFDVVVVNNAFIYLPNKDEMRRALAAIARVTAPGGRLILFHANKWQLREPFTRSPMIHLFPAKLASPISRLTGWRHNHGRVHLVSAPSLKRMLADAGFEHTAVGVLRGNRVVGAPGAYFARFYALVARCPG